MTQQYRPRKPHHDRYQTLSTTLDEFNAPEGWVLAFPHPDRLRELYKQCYNAYRRKNGQPEQEYINLPTKTLQAAMRALFDLRFLRGWGQNPWILSSEPLPQWQLQSVFRAWVDKCFIHVHDDPVGHTAWDTARKLVTSEDFGTEWVPVSDFPALNLWLTPAAIAEALIGETFTVDEEIIWPEIEDDEDIEPIDYPQNSYRGVWMLGSPTNESNAIELIAWPPLYHRFTYKSKKDNVVREKEGYAAIALTIFQQTHIGGLEYQTYNFKLKRFATQPVKYLDRTWVLIRAASDVNTGFQSAPLVFRKKNENDPWLPRWDNSVPAVMQAARFGLKLPSAEDLCANPKQYMNVQGDQQLTVLIPLRASENHAWEVGIPIKEQRNLFREILRICHSKELNLKVHDPCPIVEAYSAIARPPVIPSTLTSKGSVPRTFLDHIVPEKLIIEVYCRQTEEVTFLLTQINDYIFAGRLEFSVQPVSNWIDPLPANQSFTDKQTLMAKRLTKQFGKLSNSITSYRGCLVEIDPKDHYKKNQDPKIYLQQIATRFGRIVKCFTWEPKEDSKAKITRLINTLIDLVLVDLVNIPPAYEHFDEPQLDKKGNPKPAKFYLPPAEKFVEVCLWIERYNRRTGLNGQSGTTAYAVAVLPDGRRAVYFPRLHRWLNWQEAIAQISRPMASFQYSYIEQILNAIDNYFAEQTVILTVKAASTRYYWPWLQNWRYVSDKIFVPVERLKNNEWKEKEWLPKNCKLQIVRIREPYEIGIGYALKRDCPKDMNLDPQEKDASTADDIFEILGGKNIPPTFISSARKPQTQQTAKNASKIGGMRVKIAPETVINEETQQETKVRKAKLAEPEKNTRFAYPQPRELCILWHTEEISPTLIAQHIHDSRYRAPHFPDATEQPLSGFLAERLGDKIKRVAEAETENNSEEDFEASE